MPTSKYRDKSGTIQAAGQSQSAGPANAGRRSLFIYNPHTETEVLWVNFGAAAVIGGAGSIGLAAGAALQYDRPSYVPDDEVFVNAGTVGHKFTIKEA